MAQDPVIQPQEEPAPPEAPARELGALLAPEIAPPPPATRPSEPPLPSAARASAPTPHAAYLARRHFGALDGLRAIGILVVVGHHVLSWPEHLGANLFFLLSGFLVTTLLVRERAKKGTIDVRRFRTRRARRLYPLYFTVLGAYVALVGGVEPAGPARDAFFAHLPAFATFTSNWFVDLDGTHTIFYFAWSLAAQEQFYLVWPLYLKHVSLRACAAALVSGLATVYLMRAGVFDLALPAGSVVRNLVLSVMPALLLGASIALALNARPGFELARRVLGGRWTALVLLALAFVLWRMPGAPEPLMHATLAALTVACAVREDHVLARVLRLRALVHVGTVSYGIYLTHMLCHNAVARALAHFGLGFPALDFALTVALVIAVATLSHRYFEDRFLPAEKRRKPARLLPDPQLSRGS